MASFERIDVTGLIAICTAFAKADSREGDQIRLSEINAVVAELIAGMRQVLIEATESPNSDRMRLEVIEELTRAALARVGSAA